MKQRTIYLVVLVYVFFAVWATSAAFSATSGKSFSIVYSSDERGAITPCG